MLTAVFSKGSFLAPQLDVQIQFVIIKTKVRLLPVSLHQFADD